MFEGSPAKPEFVRSVGAVTSESTMTFMGTINKTIILMLIVAATFIVTFNMATEGFNDEFQEVIRNKTLTNAEMPTAIAIPELAYKLAAFGSFVGFLLALFIIFNQQVAPYVSPFYAACQGLTLGAVSAGFEAKYPGIVMEAVAGSFGTLFGMLAIYRLGLIVVNLKFMIGLLAAMLGIITIYVIDGLMQTFGGSYIPIVHSSSGWGIAFQVAIVLVAALNFAVDFSMIEEGVETKAPKYMEWYCAFSILVTLVWLYLEILRLLAKAKSDD